MPGTWRPFEWFYHEFGLDSLYQTGRDAWLLIAARCLRMLAFGTNSLVIALFFAALNFSDSSIGLFMTLTLAGDVLLSLGLTLVADKLGRRKILLGGSLLMVCSGAIFGYFENFWILLFAAVVGVMSATGGDFGPFRSIEESILSQLTLPSTRPDVLSWYITFSSFGSAIGVEVTGQIVTALQARDGWSIKDAYHAVFWLYSIMGIANIVLTLSLSAKCEAPSKEQEKAEESEMLMMNELGESDQAVPQTRQLHSQTTTQASRNGFLSKISSISGTTRNTMYGLWFLLTVDSLADGMVGYSLTSYYLDEKFHVSKSTLGDVLSINYFLASLSTIFAGPLARRIGLVNTMVFTHIPSSAAVLLFPFPNNVALSFILLLIRGGLNNMDQAPRAAFIAGVVRPEERTAVMGITATLRTLGSTLGPTLTGLLAGSNRFWIAFVAAGALRLAYDFGLWAMFVNTKLHQHEGEQIQQTTTDEEAHSSTSTVCGSEDVEDDPKHGMMT